MSDIREALDLLDHGNPDHWTDAGLPSVSVVKALVGSNVTREEINEVDAEFRRQPDSVIDPAQDHKPEISEPDNRPDDEPESAPVTAEDWPSPWAGKSEDELAKLHEIAMQEFHEAQARFDHAREEVEKRREHAASIRAASRTLSKNWTFAESMHHYKARRKAEREKRAEQVREAMARGAGNSRSALDQALAGRRRPRHQGAPK